MLGYDNLLEECNKSLVFYTNHIETLRENIDIQEKAKSLLLEFNPDSDLSDFEEIEKFNNYNGYVTIATLDLAVNLKNLINAKLDWEKAFFIKNSYLIIHETSKKLKPFKGKSFVQNIIENKYPELTEDLKDLLTQIDSFRNSNNYLKILSTRHNIAGHIEDSLKLYFDIVKNLDGEEAAQLISIFLNILDKALLLTKNYAIKANIRQKEKSQHINSQISALLDKVQGLIK